MNDQNYQIKSDDAYSKSIVVHRNRLKLCFRRDNGTLVNPNEDLVEREHIDDENSEQVDSEHNDQESVSTSSNTNNTILVHVEEPESAESNISSHQNVQPVQQVVQNDKVSTNVI